MRIKQNLNSNGCSVSSNRLSLQVRASTGSDSTCIAVKEDFADEEDFVKAGGSEILYVQMQQCKGMDEQSKLTDKVILCFSVLFTVDLYKHRCTSEFKPCRFA